MTYVVHTTFVSNSIVLESFLGSESLLLKVEFLIWNLPSLVYKKLLIPIWLWHTAILLNFKKKNSFNNSSF